MVKPPMGNNRKKGAIASNQAPKYHEGKGESFTTQPLLEFWCQALNLSTG